MPNVAKLFISLPNIDDKIAMLLQDPENIDFMEAAQQLALRTDTTPIKAAKTLIKYGDSLECSAKYDEAKDFVRTHLPEMSYKELQASIKRFSESFETKKLTDSSKIVRKEPKAVRLAKKINELNNTHRVFGYILSARVVRRNHVHINVAHESMGLQRVKYDKGRINHMILSLLDKNPELKGVRITVQHPTERGYATIGQAVML